MCGIIGITGTGPVLPRLIDSLKRLEYRGYDSAGVAAPVDGKVERRRAKGKIRELETVLAAEPLSATTGIGHTRWITHCESAGSALSFTIATLIARLTHAVPMHQLTYVQKDTDTRA